MACRTKMATVNDAGTAEKTKDGIVSALNSYVESPHDAIISMYLRDFGGVI